MKLELESILKSILKVIEKDGFRSHEVDWTIATIIREVQKGEPEAMRFVASLIHNELTGRNEQ